MTSVRCCPLAHIAEASALDLYEWEALGRVAALIDLLSPETGETLKASCEKILASEGLDPEHWRVCPIPLIPEKAPFPPKHDWVVELRLSPGCPPRGQRGARRHAPTIAEKSPSTTRSVP